VVVTFLPLREAPVDLSREEAREAARRELADPAYSQDDPGLVERLLIWLGRELTELFARAADATPGGWRGLVVLVILVLLIAAVVRYRLGPLARRAGTRDALFDVGELSADDHRRAAEQAAGRQNWAEAIRDRLRAIVRDLEERDLLEPRLGRTAHEAALDAGRVLPSLAPDLLSAASTFEDVWYGGRPATATMYGALRDLDARVGRSRPASVLEGSR
jgi:Domain of unknown function (DUF4129)